MGECELVGVHASVRVRVSVIQVKPVDYFLASMRLHDVYECEYLND